MKEATLRDYFYGTVSVETLATEIREAVEPLSETSRQVHIQDLPAGEQVTITAPMLVRLCDAHPPVSTSRIRLPGPDA